MVGPPSTLPVTPSLRKKRTDKLVLYSGSGFSDAASAKASEHGITAMGTKDLTQDQLETKVLIGLKSIWPKLLMLKPEKARVWVERPHVVH